MGMYTELVLKAEYRDKCPPEIRPIFEFLFNKGPYPKELPDDVFFKTSRWEQIGRSCSYYHIPWIDSGIENSYLFCRCDLKNYNQEIIKFMKWAKQYIRPVIGEVYGWIWYEEDETPTLLTDKVIDDGKVY